jgi:hypothetical protein
MSLPREVLMSLLQEVLTSPCGVLQTSPVDNLLRFKERELRPPCRA